jgi:hypothetical protein
MTYRKDTKTVLYRSKMNPTLKKKIAFFSMLNWIAISTQGEQPVHYYGY